MSSISQTSTPFPPTWSVANLLAHLGDIPPERIRIHPAPGEGTVEDVIRIEAEENCLCELIDGTLVEKTVGYLESQLAILIGFELLAFVRAHKLGKIFGADGPFEILPNLVRMPDVCFLAWDRFPHKELPRRPIPALIPSLAVEILSPNNRPGEMNRKLADYFGAGVNCVWYVDAEARTANIYTSPTDVTFVPADGELSAENLLPGLKISLAELFAEAEEMRPPEE